MQGSGFRVQGSEFRVQGSGFRVQGVSDLLLGHEFAAQNNVKGWCAEYRVVIVRNPLLLVV